MVFEFLNEWIIQCNLSLFNCASNKYGLHKQHICFLIAVITKAIKNTSKCKYTVYTHHLFLIETPAPLVVINAVIYCN